MIKHKEISEAVGRLALGKIIPLQKGYVGSSSAASSRARASLARLRRLAASTGSCEFLVGEDVFGSWPHELFSQFGARAQDEDRAATALEAALSLFAIHQQSSKKCCAITRSEGEDSDSYRKRLCRGSFGTACRTIQPKLDEASGIRRRLMSIEAASAFDGVLYGMRGLIRLMRPFGEHELVQLDYGRLAAELYLLQLSEEWRKPVIAGWSRDYFSSE